MASSLSSRVRKLEDGAIGGEQVAAATQRFRRTGELPKNPRLAHRAIYTENLRRHFSRLIWEAQRVPPEFLPETTPPEPTSPTQEQPCAP